MGTAKMTEARRLIDSATFDPGTLKMLGQAFDETWASIVDSIGSDPTSIETARTKLATIMLGLAKDRQLSGEPLKITALRLFRAG